MSETLQQTMTKLHDETIDVCEKCGEEVYNKLVGDEVYRCCPDCGFGIQQ